MRQAGILAAAGIYALEHHVARLSDDHEHARRIAETLAQTGWAQLTVSDVETNIIFFSVHGTDASSVVTALARKGIRCSGEGETIRLVTNLDLSDEDTDAVCHLIGEIDPKEFTS
jgi:threonine aldolase